MISQRLSSGVELAPALRACGARAPPELADRQTNRLRVHSRPRRRVSRMGAIADLGKITRSLEAAQAMRTSLIRLSPTIAARIGSKQRAVIIGRRHALAVDTQSSRIPTRPLNGAVVSGSPRKHSRLRPAEPRRDRRAALVRTSGRALHEGAPDRTHSCAIVPPNRRRWGGALERNWPSERSAFDGESRGNAGPS